MALKKSQESLRNWTKQKWTTASGKKSLDTGEAYFPAAAVAALKKAGLYDDAVRQKKALQKQASNLLATLLRFKLL